MDTNIEDAENQLFTYYALQILTYIALPMVLSNAIKLKMQFGFYQNPHQPAPCSPLLEVIAEAGLDARISAYEITLRLSISNHEAPDMIDRMLQLLASYSIVTCIQQDCESKPVNEGGIAFEKIHGMHEYESLVLNAELNEVFNNAMVETFCQENAEELPWFRKHRVYGGCWRW
ncbi:caffeic acid 3-O-methyltransferase [Artemisia annua]|uniref:Caffeic acid 3-O-methyltransferase n=1 Tax=Artemisia annua TaxID=35608 RepID=A0A2U1NU17_ARTAN|nr:caffeic acid 3-O-methyltransferase [Artemisia annua]